MQTQSHKDVVKSITTASQLEGELQLSQAQHGVAVLDIYNAEWGHCKTLSETFRRLFTDAGDLVHLRFFSVECNAVLESLKNPEEAKAQPRQKGMEFSPETLVTFWSKMLERRQNRSEPFFAFYKEGKMRTQLEGIDTPRICRIVHDLCKQQNAAAEYITNPDVLQFWEASFPAGENEVVVADFHRAVRVLLGADANHLSAEDLAHLTVEAHSGSGETVTAAGLQSFVGDTDTMRGVLLARLAARQSSPPPLTTAEEVEHDAGQEESAASSHTPPHHHRHDEAEEPERQSPSQPEEPATAVSPLPSDDEEGNANHVDEEDEVRPPTPEKTAAQEDAELAEAAPAALSAEEEENSEAADEEAAPEPSAASHEQADATDVADTTDVADATEAHHDRDHAEAEQEEEENEEEEEEEAEEGDVAPTRDVATEHEPAAAPEDSMPPTSPPPAEGGDSTINQIFTNRWVTVTEEEMHVWNAVAALPLHYPTSTTVMADLTGDESAARAALPDDPEGTFPTLAEYLAAQGVPYADVNMMCIAADQKVGSESLSYGKLSLILMSCDPDVGKGLVPECEHFLRELSSGTLLQQHPPLAFTALALSVSEAYPDEGFYHCLTDSAAAAFHDLQENDLFILNALTPLDTAAPEDGQFALRIIGLPKVIELATTDETDDTMVLSQWYARVRVGERGASVLTVHFVENVYDDEFQHFLSGYIARLIEDENHLDKKQGDVPENEEDEGEYEVDDVEDWTSVPESSHEL